MKIIKPGYEIIPNDMDILKKIEMVARVCYKSEDRIKEGSAEKLVSALIKRGHEAMLEHGSFCFLIDNEAYVWFASNISNLEKTTLFKSYLTITRNSSSTRYVISGNVRAWREFFSVYAASMHGLMPEFTRNFIKSNPLLFPEFQKDIRFINFSGMMVPLSDDELVTKEEKLAHQRLSVKFIVDRGVSHEIVRHRPASFGQESTRYCNYIKDDFGGEIAVIKPFYLEEGTHGYTVWKGACETAETAYFNLLNWGCSPEEARGVLPTHLKTEVVMTATLSEWVHFFNLRALGTTGAPHPQMRQVAAPLLEDMKTIESEIFEDLEVKTNG